MADPPPYPGTGHDIGDDPELQPDRGSTTGPPRWVAVLVIAIAIVLVLLIVGSHLSGSVGPGAH